VSASRGALRARSLAAGATARHELAEQFWGELHGQIVAPCLSPDPIQPGIDDGNALEPGTLTRSSCRRLMMIQADATGPAMPGRSAPAAGARRRRGLAVALLALIGGARREDAGQIGGAAQR
jgi:hypothetical protein